MVVWPVDRHRHHYTTGFSPDKKALYDEIIRIDQAGERGAQQIYAGNCLKIILALLLPSTGQLAILKDLPVEGPVIKVHPAVLQKFELILR